MSRRVFITAIGAAYAAVTIGCSDATSPNASPRTTPPHDLRPSDALANLPTTAPILYQSYNPSLGGFIASVSSEGAIEAGSFLVPAGEAWAITQVVFTGILREGRALPFAIRADKDGLPGSPLSGGSFTLVPTASDEIPRNPTGYYPLGPLNDYL